jgi:DNA repair photolyase
VKRLTVHNPANRFAETEVVYLEDEEAPRAELEVYFDKTGSVLAKNDSPDVGFTYSVNPYRGCFHGCAYCLDGDTPILMGDASTRALRDLRVGDFVYGTEVRGRYRRYVRTQVLAHWRTVKPAYRIVLADGTTLVASGDHRFLTERGWKYVSGARQGAARRPHLTLGNRLIGTGAFVKRPAESADYERGYVCGVVRGGTRLALVDLPPVQRVRRYLADFVLAQAQGARRIDTRIEQLCAWPSAPSREWQRGFLAGIFDADGSHGDGILRIASADPNVLEATKDACRAHGFDAVVERGATGRGIVRVRGGLREHLRFAHLTSPAISRKWELEDRALKGPPRLRIVGIEPLGVDVPMFDITTGTGDFIANGVVSHNCFARPTHEYLSFGAGTDFERKIVVKKDAPALLRKALSAKGWRGDLLMFSGVTDCYQPLENRYRLTRGCLEVCADYKNPVHVITKSPLVERDIDVLVRLSRVAHFSIAISLPFLREDHARALEPYVTTPARRLRVIERLAEAGIRVGVSVAPVIPGLNDEDVPSVLEAARAAGAQFAGYTLLRLPGHVKDVFESRIRAALPEKAERVMSHVRQSRDGKLYDATFGVRGRGTGPYAEAIARLFAATSKRLGYELPDERAEGSPGMLMGPNEERIEPGGPKQLTLF